MSLKRALTKKMTKKMLKYLLHSSINHMEVKKIIRSAKGKCTIKLLLLVTKKTLSYQNVLREENNCTLC